MGKKNVGIIGLGEVGIAIKKLSSKKFNTYYRDLYADEIGSNTIDYLHICIPYTDNFENIVVSAIKEIKPSLTIINSTVRPGTTRNIFKKTKSPIAHTPIMGVHPSLDKYQKIFTKVIGAVNEKSYQLANTHWKDLGSSNTEKFDGPEESELAKVLSTTYYGWNIVFNKAAKKLSDKHKTNFKQVYEKFNSIYNKGYKKTKPNVVRPNLNYEDGEIGGHCVLPNASFMTDDDLFTEFLRLAKKFS